MFSLGRRQCLRLSFAGVVLAAFAASCAGQTSRVAGAIQGSVVDQTGNIIAGASVTVRNQGTNQTRTMLPNAQGFFRAGELPVGQYELRVESPGFSPYVNRQIVVSIGKVLQVGVRLTPATVQQQITVSEQPPPIDPSETTEATTIDHERIEESPVVSRNYLDFVLLAPQLTRSNIQGGTGGKDALADSGFSFAGHQGGSNERSPPPTRQENHQGPDWEDQQMTGSEKQVHMSPFTDVHGAIDSRIGRQIGCFEMS